MTAMFWLSALLGLASLIILAPQIESENFLVDVLKLYHISPRLVVAHYAIPFSVAFGVIGAIVVVFANNMWITIGMFILAAAVKAYAAVNWGYDKTAMVAQGKLDVVPQPARALYQTIVETRDASLLRYAPPHIAMALNTLIESTPLKDLFTIAFEAIDEEYAQLPSKLSSLTGMPYIIILMGGIFASMSYVVDLGGFMKFYAPIVYVLTVFVSIVVEKIVRM